MSVEAQLREIIRSQQEVLLMLERSVRQHHHDFGIDPRDCSTCSFWLERISQLRRQVRRLGV